MNTAAAVDNSATPASERAMHGAIASAAAASSAWWEDKAVTVRSEAHALMARAAECDDDRQRDADWLRAQAQGLFIQARGMDLVAVHRSGLAASHRERSAG